MAHDGTAEDIADSLLYDTGRGIMGGNYDLFRSCFELPSIVETAQGQRILDTEEAFQKAFDDVRNSYLVNGITDFARVVLSAKFLAVDLVGSTHASSLLLRNGNLFRKPYPVYSVIRLYAGQWRIRSCTYAILDWPELNAALVPDKPSYREGA